MKLSELKHGEKLVADGGFTCLRKNQVVMVNDSNDGKYIHCRRGKHYLDGQEEEETGEIIGFTRPEERKPAS